MKTKNFIEKKLVIIFVMAFICSMTFSGCTDSKNDEIIDSVSDENVLNGEVSDNDDTTGSNNDEFPTPEDRKVTKSQDEDKDDEEAKDDKTSKDDGDSENKEISEDEVSDDNSESFSQRDKILEALEREKEYYDDPNSYDKTDDMYEIDKEIINNSYFDFSDKLITVIGDSIVSGVGCSDDEEGKHISFARYLGEIAGTIYLENMGVPGATMGAYIGDTSVYNRINDIPDGSDIIVILAGVNDYINYNGMLGSDPSEEGTYTHDVEVIMRSLRDRFPEADIFVVTTYKNVYEDNPDYNTSYAFDSFLQIQRQYAREYGIHVIDTHKWGFLDNRDENIKNQFFADNIHLNNDGARVLAKHVLAHIISTYAEEGR